MAQPATYVGKQATRPLFGIESLNNEEHNLGPFIPSQNWDSLRREYQKLVIECAREYPHDLSGHPSDKDIYDAVSDFTVLLYIEKHFKWVDGISLVSDVVKTHHLDCDMATILFVDLLLQSGLSDSSMRWVCVMPDSFNLNAHVLFRAGSLYYETDLIRDDSGRGPIHCIAYPRMEDASYQLIPHYSEYRSGHSFFTNSHGILEEFVRCFDSASAHKDFALKKTIMEHAMDVAHRVLDGDPQNPEMHYFVAELLWLSLIAFEVGNGDDMRHSALRHLEKALLFDPEDYRSWLVKGDLLDQLGKKSEAKKAFEIAFRYAPLNLPNREDFVRQYEKLK